MTRAEAIRLIRTPEISDAEPQIWADLGAGSGTFTLALSDLLAPGSRIYAVDKKSGSLENIPAVANITIEKIQEDFTVASLIPDKLNGIVLANTLHFVKNKMEFLKKISGKLLPGGIFLIVEYDLLKSNLWVPYPLPFVSMEKLFVEGMGRSVRKLGEMSSRYNRSTIYGAVAR